jgi:nitroimidazol reductase NimA-like FMN-containing flavoprotein (pyridoxamine 5'-phosphate oxidase superfamily)
VVARSGFHHLLDCRSVMAFGTAALVDDPAEKGDPSSTRSSNRSPRDETARSAE